MARERQFNLKLSPVEMADAALAIVVTTAEPWDAILRAAAILREGR
jgi:hypothetical protein